MLQWMKYQFFQKDDVKIENIAAHVVHAGTSAGSVCRTVPSATPFQTVRPATHCMKTSGLLHIQICTKHLSSWYENFAVFCDAHPRPKSNSVSACIQKGNPFVICRCKTVSVFQIAPSTSFSNLLVQIWIGNKTGVFHVWSGWLYDSTNMPSRCARMRETHGNVSEFNTGTLRYYDISPPAALLIFLVLR